MTLNSFTLSITKRIIQRTVLCPITMTALIALLQMTGCATQSQLTKDNYTAIDVPQTLVAASAHDAAIQLTTLYATTSTVLNITQATNDSFGEAFVTELRKKGFAVKELEQPPGLSFLPEPIYRANRDQSAQNNPAGFQQSPRTQSKLQNQQSEQDQQNLLEEGDKRKVSDTKNPKDSPNQLPDPGTTVTVGYLLDKIEEHYYLQLTIDSIQLTRAYAVRNDEATPIGQWVRKE